MNFLYDTAYNLNGMEVYIVEPVFNPNFRLSAALDLTPSFKKEMDDWCDAFFGYHVIESITDGQVIKAHGRFLMNRKTYEEAKRLL